MVRVKIDYEAMTPQSLRNLKEEIRLYLENHYRNVGK